MRDIITGTPVDDSVDEATVIEALPDEFDSCIGMSLADAIREGCKDTVKEEGWGDGIETACALTAAGMTIKSKGYRVDNKK